MDFVKEQYRWIAEAISTWAAAQPDISAVAVIGSQSRAKGCADEWSDLDLLIMAQDPDRLIEHETAGSRGNAGLSRETPVDCCGDDCSWRVRLVSCGSRHASSRVKARRGRKYRAKYLPASDRDGSLAHSSVQSPEQHPACRRHCVVVNTAPRRVGGRHAAPLRPFALTVLFDPWPLETLYLGHDRTCLRRKWSASTIDG